MDRYSAWYFSCASVSPSTGTGRKLFSATRCLILPAPGPISTGRHCLQACLDGSEHVLLSNGAFHVPRFFACATPEISNSVSSPFHRLPPPAAIRCATRSDLTSDVARPLTTAGVTGMSASWRELPVLQLHVRLIINRYMGKAV